MSKPISGDVADVIAEGIVAAAQSVFSRVGLDASLAEIAADAGVGVASVYRRFSSKDDLIHACYHHRVSSMADRAEAASAGADPWFGFEQLFRSSVSDFAVDRGLRELVTTAAGGSLGWSRGKDPDQLKLLVETSSARMESALTALIHRAQLSGALRADVDAPAILMLSLALQSAAALGDPERHAVAISVVLDGLRSRPRGTSPMPETTT